MLFVLLIWCPDLYCNPIGPLGTLVQEEQAGGSSANYDVELIHLAEAHRDILRAGT